VSSKRIVAGTALALAGVMAAIGIGLLANTISGDSVGLSAEPLSAGDALAPSATQRQRAERRLEVAQRREARQRRRQTAARRRRQAATENATTAPTTEPPTTSTTGGDDDGGGDDSSGRGRGRGRSGGDDSGSGDSGDSSGHGSDDVFDD
jgi:hypothetical protein